MKAFILVISFFVTALFSSISQAQCTMATTIEGAIGASTLDLLERIEAQAVKQNCESIFLRVNTPGGNLYSTRLIVEKILNSKIPYLCLITPRGAHAGSAGAIIMQACHVSGAVPATNIGAATPISGDGKDINEDLRKKVLNDTVSWLQGITKLRGRNLEFSQQIIEDALAVSSEEAVKRGAIDLLVSDELNFMMKAEGRSVSVGFEKELTQVKVGPLTEFDIDLRHRFLSFIADPEFAYLLMMGSLALLYFEITHPGMMVPGVIGGIGFILSLVAFHKLNVEWGGFGLMALGLALIVAEIFVSSFGILGIGGVAAVVFGSILLFDEQTLGYTLPLYLVFTVGLLLSAFVFILGTIAIKSLRFKSPDVDSALIGKEAQVITLGEDKKSGQLKVFGEIWKFECDEEISQETRLEIVERRNLTLKVKVLT